jgi:hypothetical protein
MSTISPEKVATPEKLSKKKISKTLYQKLATTLAEYNLTGKKFDNKLKKASKLLATDIARANRKKTTKAKAKKKKAGA